MPQSKQHGKKATVQPASNLFAVALWKGHLPPFRRRCADENNVKARQTQRMNAVHCPHENYEPDRSWFGDRLAYIQHQL
jgi:hypothetical protein